MKKYVSPLAEVTKFDIEELIMSGVVSDTPAESVQPTDSGFVISDEEESDGGWGELHM